MSESSSCVQSLLISKEKICSDDLTQDLLVEKEKESRGQTRFSGPLRSTNRKMECKIFGKGKEIKEEEEN